MLRATVGLQGRPAHPGQSWSIPLTITLTPRGAAAPRYTLHTTTDVSGVLTLPDLAPGIYDIRVKGAHTLRNLLRDVNLAAGDNGRGLGWLAEGDVETATSANQVTGADLALLASAINRCAGDPGFVPNADLDESGCVTMADFGLLSGNYGRQGDVPAQLGGLPTDPGGQALLAIEPAQLSVEQGQLVSVAVVLDPRGALASGAMVRLRYDPASVEVVSVQLGQRLSTVLQQPLVDNRLGDLRLGAGLLAQTIGEKITVATLSLRLKSEAAPARSRR